MPTAELTGQRFDRLTVTGRDESRNTAKSKFWHCVCECGGATSVRTEHLTRGKVRSCGCLRREVTAARGTTHGLTTGERRGTRTYIAWAAMRFRCNNPNASSYERYGARGIRVCPEWDQSFEQFLADMGECPDGMTIERNDNSNGYGPDNCRWATAFDQNRNRRSNRFLTHDGVTLCTSDWAKRTGIQMSTLLGRMNRGWSDKAVLTTPLRHTTSRARH